MIPTKIRDVTFVKRLLPRSYQVSQDSKGIICSSHMGVEDWQWNRIFSDIKEYFGDRFQEVYHTINSKHKEFRIYLKQ